MSIQDLLIVECAEGVAGPCCGLQFADLGARVIKIETPAGDRAREWGPPMVGDTAAIFVHLNRGKQSVVLDFARADDRAAFETILAQTDAVVAQNDPAEPNNPGWQDLARRHPQLVVCEIDDLGPAGPMAGLPGSELTVQAMSGFTHYIGDAGGPPCRIGFDIAGMATAMHAYQGIAAGLLHRHQHQSAQYFRVSALNSLLSMKSILLAVQTGGMDEWIGFHFNGPHWPADTGWDTKDGQITFDFRHDQRDEWVAFCEQAGLGYLPGHPDYKDWRSTIYIGDRRFEFGEPYRKFFADKTCAEASGLINGLGGISVKFQDYAEMLAHPQVKVQDPLVDVPDEKPNAQQQLGMPFRYAGEPRRKQYAHAPSLGEHTGAVVAEFTNPAVGRKRSAASGRGA
jgi:crotonobetainyl-CoA:carnitine CoA-transferase CaiB-like acyl-CoA transferase